jgi:hypothetical protein
MFRTEQERDTMTEFDKHSYELCGAHEDTPQSLRAALLHEIFQGGTVDVFVDYEQYRVENAYARLSPKGLAFDATQKPRFLHFVKKQWVSTLKRNFPVLFSERAPSHLVHGPDKLVIFYAFMQGTVGKGTAQVVLYPQNRPPSHDSKFIVGWNDEVNYILNGNFKPYVVT